MASSFILFMIRVVREVKVVDYNWSSMLWILEEGNVSWSDNCGRFCE